MEVRGADHAADEVLATIATPEPASGVHQVSSQAAQEPVAAGEGEQDQDAPAEVDDDDLFDTPNIRRRSSGLEATAATKKAKLAGVQGTPTFSGDVNLDLLPQGGAEDDVGTTGSDAGGRPSVRRPHEVW